MSGSVNKVILVGNLGRDVEIRTTQNGMKIANLRIATSERWKDKQSGEYQEKTEWHSVAIFNEHLVGVCERFLKKGSKVYVEGQLQTRKWSDQQGNDRYSTEVVLNRFRGDLQLLDAKESGGQREVNDPARQEPHGSGPAGFGGFGDGLDSDEVPFGPVM